jgi:hypothetical protein
MARLAGETNQLTLAEQTLLDFLHDHKGTEFTPDEIEIRTGIHISKINDIMDNLRWKGYEVCTEKHRDVHYYANNTWRSYLLGGIIFGSMMLAMIYSFIMAIE